MNETLICSSCQKSIPPSEIFRRHKDNVICRECNRLRNRIYYRKEISGQDYSVSLTSGDMPKFTCEGCGAEKPIADFRPDRRTTIGHKRECVPCENARVKRLLQSGRKVCPRCSVERNTSEFYRNKTTKDGLTAYCVPCIKETQKKFNAEESARNAEEKRLREDERFKLFNDKFLSCCVCNEIKPFGDFPSPHFMLPKKRYACVACVAQHQAIYTNKTDLEIARILRTNAASADYRAKSDKRDEIRQRRIEKVYGLTHQDLQAMLDAQDHRCLGCNKQLTSNNMHIDHDHDSGLVRGLLCNKCNQALGMCDDDPATLVNLSKYIERTRMKAS